MKEFKIAEGHGLFYLYKLSSLKSHLIYGKLCILKREIWI